MKSRYLLLLILATAFSVFFAERSFAQTNSPRHEVDVDYTTSYSPIWNDSGSGADSNVSFWRPNITSGWSRVGHHISKGYRNPQGATMLVRPRTSGAIADPIDYTLIWTDAGSGASQNGSVWRPVCRNGYQALGDVTSSSHAKPTTTEMVCVHESALVNANPGNLIWDDKGSGATADFGSWEINPFTGDQSRGLFFGSASHTRPQITLWAIRSTTIQPATQGNDPVEEQFWDSVKNSSQARDFQSYLRSYPNGKYASLAGLKISQIGGSTSSTPNPIPNPTPVSTTGSTSSVEEQYWDAVKNSSKAQDFQSYLRDYPNGQFTPIARLKLQQLQSGTTNPTQTNSNTEDQYWNSISNSQRPQDFQSYLNTYPNGQYAAIARLRINQLNNSNPVNNANPTNPVKPINKTQTDDDFIRTAQPGSINELSQSRKFFVAGDDFAVKKAIAEAIQREVPQLEVALTEQDADFFILCNLTDSTTNATVTNDSSNPNLFGDFIVFTVVSQSNASQKRIRIQFRQKSGRSFGVITDTPDVKLAKEFAKRLKKILR